MLAGAIEHKVVRAVGCGLWQVIDHAYYTDEATSNYGSW
jgi:hypothetical protein